MIDREVIIETVEGDLKLLEEVVQLFNEQSAIRLVRMRRAIEEKDAKSVEETAHGLKGSLLNFGAQEAVELALNLEKMGLENNLDHSTPAYDQLLESVDQVKSELARMTGKDSV